jgi:hypothetical protein
MFFLAESTRTLAIAAFSLSAVQLFGTLTLLDHHYLKTKKKLTLLDRMAEHNRDVESSVQQLSPDGLELAMH